MIKRHITAQHMTTSAANDARVYIQKPTYSRAEHQISQSNTADTATLCDADWLVYVAQHLKNRPTNLASVMQTARHHAITSHQIIILYMYASDTKKCRLSSNASKHFIINYEIDIQN